MRNRILIALLFCSLSLSLISQNNDTIVLDSLLSWSVRNYPLSNTKNQEYNIYQARKLLLNKNYLPEFSLNGQVSYQSDVTSIPIDFSNIEIEMPVPGPSPVINFPEIPDAPKDSYKATLDMRQVIWDGGMTKKQKELEKTDLYVKWRTTDVDIYKIKETATDVYFTLLLLRENKKILELTKEDIQQQINKMEAVIKQGMILASDQDILKAELINLEQKIIEIDENILAAYRILSHFTNRKIDQSSIIMVPESKLELTFLNARPEYVLMSFQQDKLGATKSLLNSRYMPVVAGFGQAGYGKPGLNFFSDEFGTWFLVGVSVSWKLWDWNKNTVEKNILDLQSEIIETKKEAYSFSLIAAHEQTLASYRKYSALIEKDKELIQLRKKLKKTAASQHMNGTITSSDYITKVNEEARAQLKLKSDEIQLTKTKYELRKINGKL